MINVSTVTIKFHIASSTCELLVLPISVQDLNCTGRLPCSVSLAVMQIFILIWRIVTNCLKNYSAYESTIKPFWWIWWLCSLPPSSVGQCLPDVMVSNTSLLHIYSSSVVLCHTSPRQRESLQSCRPSKEEMDGFIWAGKNSHFNRGITRH